MNQTTLKTLGITCLTIATVVSYFSGNYRLVIVCAVLLPAFSVAVFSRGYFSRKRRP
jgi:hypothetical protein